MYESFFEFTARPFLSSPIADRYYPATVVEQARETVLRCVERAEGPALILGPAGTGKSTLCQVIAEQLHDKFRVAMLASARLCTRRALLQNILFELKLPYRERDEGELRLALLDALEPTAACPQGMVLIVDEAHVLPLRLLEEIRLITNLVRGGEPRVRLVLAAGMILDERMASPRLESFNQRIAARCYLQAMSRDDTCGYVRAQITTVGGDPDRVFTGAALQAVFRATDGVPRLVNQLCDHVLLMAAIGRRAPIEPAGVEEAWADLQQLPTPWNRDEPEGRPARATIEFGQLDDEPRDGDDAQALPEECGLSAPAPAASAATQLNQIQSQIATLTRDEWDGTPPADELESTPPPIPAHQHDPESEFRPRSPWGPEIELVFHRAHNPFSEPFEHEEVLVDPHRPIAAESAAVVEKATPQRSERSPQIGPSARRVEARVARPTVLLAGLQPLSTQAPRDAITSASSPRSGTDEDVPGDDRDLLEIVPEASSVSGDYSVALTAHRPRRREYRQLFASLRRR